MRNLSYVILLLIWSFIIPLLQSCSKTTNDEPAPAELPKLGTSAIVKVSKTYAIVSSSVTSTGNATITQKGFCWSKNPNPTILDSVMVSLAGTNSYTDTIKGFRYNTTYYIRSFASNIAGTAYGPELQLRTENTIYSLGQVMGGGKVGYIDSTGEHGLIYYYTRNYAPYPWALTPYGLVGNTSRNIGAGRTNTQKILMENNNRIGTAAKFCDDFISDGYTDWFLPSSGELEVIRLSIGFFDISGALFWSSSEASAFNAHLVPINATSTFSVDGKGSNWSVMPVREF